MVAVLRSRESNKFDSCHIYPNILFVFRYYTLLKTWFEYLGLTFALIQDWKRIQHFWHFWAKDSHSFKTRIHIVIRLHWILFQWFDYSMLKEKSFYYYNEYQFDYTLNQIHNIFEKPSNRITKRSDQSAITLQVRPEALFPSVHLKEC